MPGEKENALTEALEEWRDKVAKELLGPNNFFLHGGASVMTDKVIADIVKFASKGKLPDIDALRVQARWRRAHKYGNEVLSLIAQHFPPVPPGSSSQAAQPLANSTASFINYGVESVSGSF